MTDALIVLENVGKWYERKRRSESQRADERPGLWALRHVNLSIPPGCTMGVLGVSGAGKTTLLRLLARMTLPTEGRVIGRGRVLPMFEMKRPMMPLSTVRENLLLKAATFGVPETEVLQAAAEIAAFAEVDESALDIEADDLQKGAHARLMFSMAMHLRPTVLLADDMLIVGDRPFRRKCLDRIEEEKKRGMSVLFASHDLAMVRSISDTVTWLDNGRLAMLGPPADVGGSYAHHLALSRRTNQEVLDVEHVLSPIGLRVLDAQGAEVSAFRRDEPVQIEISFQTRMKDVDVSISVDVFADAALVVSDICPQPAKIAEPSAYVATMEIPASTLAPRAYTLRASLQANVANATAKATRAEIVSVNVLSEEDAPGERPGFLAPQLEWRRSRGRPLAHWDAPPSENVYASDDEDAPQASQDGDDAT